MKEIKPTYVTFEQAKLLKEKGFDIKLKDWWISANPHVVKAYYNKFDDIESKGHEEMILSKEHHSESYNVLHAPAYEQWQVVEWLRVNHGIWINVTIAQETKWEYIIGDIETFDSLYYSPMFNSPQEAYSAAFDYVLNNLI